MLSVDVEESTIARIHAMPAACTLMFSRAPDLQNTKAQSKPVTIWPLQDAAKMHVHSPELAQALQSLLQHGIPVIDLGCGMGYYVAELAKKGYTTYGVEGTPDIQGIALHKPIYQADLSEPLTVPLPDGHVLSFEVAEHLAKEDEGTFLDNVILHARARLLLSWALPEACAPGRGHGHLNCQSNIYVIRSLFLRGFAFHVADSLWLRERVRGSQAYWFEGTLLVFDALALASLSLDDLETYGAPRLIPAGSRNWIHTTPHSGGGAAVEGARAARGSTSKQHEGDDSSATPSALCARPVRVKEIGADVGYMYVVDAGAEADVALAILLSDCAVSQLSMVCPHDACAPRATLLALGRAPFSLYVRSDVWSVHVPGITYVLTKTLDLERQVCALLFLDGKVWEGRPVCPRLGESEVYVTLYGIPRGRYNVAYCPP